MPHSESNPSWEQKTIEKLLTETLKEQRRNRRWRIFFRFIYLSIFFGIIFAIWSAQRPAIYLKKPHTAVVELDGELLAGGSSSAESVNKALNKAFKDPSAKAVMLEINSPGGSPVQAGEIYDNMLRLRKAHPNTKIYAVCTDSCASGAYYVAAAADKIYADKASLVGSIGVLMNGFGFTGTLDKVGVDRRLMTSGSNKGFLDPFSPVKQKDQAYMQQMLDIIHQQFITAVEQGRGKKLQTKNPLLFSGLVWTGQQALGLGLIDGIATPDQVARNVIKAPILVKYSEDQDFLSQFTHKLGTEMKQNIATMMSDIHLS